MGEETLGHEQVEFVPGARYGDIKKTPLLLDFGVRASGEIRRNASSTTFSTKDRPPFPTLGRMRGRENEIILIQKGNPGVIAGHIEWIEHLRSAARPGLKVAVKLQRAADAVGSQTAAKSYYPLPRITARSRPPAMPETSLVVVDPGHFHATLVQQQMYPELSAGRAGLCTARP